MRKRKEQLPYEQSPAPRLLTVMQVAAALGVGKDTVYGLIKNEGLPAVSVGLAGTRQKLRVSVTSLDTWIREREQRFTGGTGILTNIQTDVQETTSKRRARKGHPSSGELPRTGTTA